MPRNISLYGIDFDENDWFEFLNRVKRTTSFKTVDASNDKENERFWFTPTKTPGGGPQFDGGNDGGGDGFEDAITLRTDYRVDYLVAKDINGDRKSDLVMNFDAGVHGIKPLIGTQNRNSPYQSMPHKSSGGFTFTLNVDDWNRDSHLDSIFLKSRSIGIHTGNADGSINNPVTIVNSLRDIWDVKTAKMNRDGHPDLVWFRTASADYQVGELVISFNNGAGSIGDTQVVQLWNNADTTEARVETGDFNGDFNTDVAILRADGKVFVAMTDHSGRVESVKSFNVAAGGLGELAVGHFNRDHYLDFAVAKEGKLSIALNRMKWHGDPISFGIRRYDDPGSGPRAIEVADFNRDGFDDIAIANAFSEDVSLYYSTYSGRPDFRGSLSALGETGSRNRPSDIVATSVDGDGDLDLVVAHDDTFSNSLGIIYGNSSEITDRPDLAFSKFNIRETRVKAGGSVRITYTLQNRGNVDFRNAWVNVFFSPDQIIDDNDVWLSSRIETLQAGRSQIISKGANLPEFGDDFWKGDGNYYVKLVANNWSQTLELSEFNNSKFDQFLVTNTKRRTADPDMRAKRIRPNISRLSAGDSFNLETILTNLGRRGSGNFKVDLFLSHDKKIEPGKDRRFASGLSTSLQGGQTKELNVNLRLPNSNHSFWKGTKNYYIGAIVDRTNQIHESNERNNRNQGMLVDMSSIHVKV